MKHLIQITFKNIFLLLVLVLLSHESIAQHAKLIITNNSDRVMTIKIMSYYEYSKPQLFGSAIVLPHDSRTSYFSSTGNFFLKVKAVRTGRDPVYTKGNPFEVYVGHDGYSVMEITYNLIESNVPNPLEGKRITKEEFEKN